MPSPPEVAQIDADISEAEQELSELLLRWRWVVYGLAAAALLECGFIISASITRIDGLVSVAGLGGVLLFASAVALGIYASENRGERIQQKRQLDRLKIERRDALAGRAPRAAAPFARYKEHLPAMAEHLKLRAQRHRRTYVSLQLVVIVGSLSASALTASINSPNSKTIAVAISLAVGVAASFSLTFRIRERGDALQATAIEIEREYRAAELRIGDYANDPDDRTRYRKLTERIESLRAEQASKERSLDQPPDMQQSSSSGI
ncbi:hypothetical protein GCM10009744_47810 [Kribbella alba]|uniref:DUF4231 domain-containing protein n=2 Tax=Kribbella alba TaxID=190197 RepID=A0ABP4RHS9_9ACTN